MDTCLYDARVSHCPLFSFVYPHCVRKINYTVSIIVTSSTHSLFTRCQHGKPLPPLADHSCMCVCLFVLCLVVDEDDDGKRFILNGIVLKIEREREKIGAVRRNVFIRTQIVKSRLPAYLKLVPIYIGFVARKRTSQGDEQKAQNSERRIGVGALQ